MKGPGAAEARESTLLYLVEEIFKHEVVVVIAGGELHVLERNGMNLNLKCQNTMCSECYS